MKICTLLLFLFASITSDANKTVLAKSDSLTSKEDFIATMTKHLNAVTDRDSKTLKSTLSPNGDMILILPKTEIIRTVDGFMDYHKDWFELPDWTFETKIVSTNIKADLGMAIVEIIYREPMRDGKPYFNRMTISYVLEKIEGNWYVIKDHASSVEKSTD